MHVGRWLQNMAQLLKLGRAQARSMARFYLAIVQTVFLYRANSWTITKRDFAALELFHKHAVRHITKQHVRRDAHRV